MSAAAVKTLESELPRWRTWVSLFAEDFEYDYLVKVNHGNDQKGSIYKEIRVKNSPVGISFTAKGKTAKERIKIKSLKKGDEKNTSSSDVIFHWDETTSSLCGVHQCDTDVFYYSHMHGGKKHQMKKNKSEVIYNFEKFCNQLAKKKSHCKFDPHQTQLQFGKEDDEQVTYLTLRSRTAGCLYDTFV